MIPVSCTGTGERGTAGLEVPAPGLQSAVHTHVLRETARAARTRRLLPPATRRDRTWEVVFSWVLIYKGSESGFVPGLWPQGALCQGWDDCSPMVASQHVHVPAVPQPSQTLGDAVQCLEWQEPPESRGIQNEFIKGC